MDRRQKKTREAIFSAFIELLSKQKYEHITVQDIIDKADVGRSTFYSHFETKDHLLRAMCSDIFDHIIDGAMCSYCEETNSLESTLSHLLIHLRESRKYVTGLLCSDSSDIFMRYLHEYLTKLFSKYVSYFHTSVPADFLINHLTGAFLQTIRWWVNENMQTPPEQTAHYFMSVIETH